MDAIKINVLKFSVFLVVPFVLFFHLLFSSASCSFLPYKPSCQAPIEQAKTLCLLEWLSFEKNCHEKHHIKFRNSVMKASLFIFCVTIFLLLFFLSFSPAVSRSFSFLIALLSSHTGILAWFQYAKSFWIVYVAA